MLLFYKLQGTLGLLPNREEDGCFRCVPGFHLLFDEWRKKIDISSRSWETRYEFSDNNENDRQYTSTIINVPCSRGHMIVWDQRLVHGTMPNYSDRPRLVQYMRLFPSVYLDMEVRERRKKSLLRKIREEALMGLNTRVFDL